MTETLQELVREPVFHYFYDICQIPHGSGNEAALAGYIAEWAGSRGLAAEKDATGNVLIRRSPSPGCEAAPIVMLQAHLDMVCEKAEESGHDFTRDPIRWVIDGAGEMLSTGGRTTLGADDGIGVALAMAVLEEKNLPLPGLEVLFTVREEDDLSGAANFDGAQMRAARLINLDHVNEHEILCGSCGGIRADFTLPVERRPVPPGWKCCRLHVFGLRGGHSGEDVHRGRGNANILLARCLQRIMEITELRLCSVRGGSSRLSLPRFAEAELCIPSDAVETAAGALAAFLTELRGEFSETAGALQLDFTETGPQTSCVEADQILSALLLIPDGIYQMNESLTGLVDASDNLGEMYLREDRFEMVLEIRSSRESLRRYLFQRMERLAGLLGGSCKASDAYPSWNFHPQSQLAAVCRRVHRKLYRTEPKFLTVHAGLEVGYFFEKKPELDAVSIGPDIWDLHSLDERLSISSVRRFYRYLCEILSALAK